MKKTKLFLASFLAVCITVLIPLTSASAAETEKTNDTMRVGNEVTFNDGVTATVLVDNEQQRVVETQDDSNIYVATFDKKTQEIDYKTYDLNRNLIPEPDETFITSESKSTDIGIDSRLSLISKNMLLDSYGYYIYSEGARYIWVAMIRTGDAKNPTEKPTNETALLNYKGSVDVFMNNKDQMVAKVGSGIISSIVVLYLVPEPVWTKVLAGLLTVVSAAIAYAEGKAMFNAYDDSRYFYGKITM